MRQAIRAWPNLPIQRQAPPRSAGAALKNAGRTSMAFVISKPDRIEFDPSWSEGIVGTRGCQEAGILKMAGALSGPGLITQIRIDSLKIRSTPEKNLEQGGIELASRAFAHQAQDGVVGQRRLVNPPPPQEIVAVPQRYHATTHRHDTP